MDDAKDTMSVSIGEGEIVLIAEVLRIHMGEDRRNYDLAKRLTFAAVKQLIAEDTE